MVLGFTAFRVEGFRALGCSRKLRAPVEYSFA